MASSAKLYPPYIAGTIPAFSGTVITVPFSFNNAVGKKEVAGFSLKIKTVRGSQLLIAPIKQVDKTYYDLDDTLQVSFILTDDQLSYFNIGQYYKAQIAFIDTDGVVGYYSTVGIIKYTTKPEVAISGMLLSPNINNHKYKYIGTYSQEDGDSTEKLYSSYFVLTNSTGDIIVTNSDDPIIHNTIEDENSYEAHEEYEIDMDLEDNMSYYIQYIATTNNGMQVKSPSYRVMQKKTIEPELNATLYAASNEEEAYIDLYLIGNKDAYGFETNTTGSYIVYRNASNNGKVWNQIYSFILESQTPSRFLYRDYTVEQGVTYTYAIQQYNDYNLFSDRLLSNEVKMDFEDMFLFDGERQLKIRYNPQVSSFKTDILESKSETIGNKYPFIFRNGNVNYKEFPLSGLISYQMDDNQSFLSKDKLDLETFSYTKTYYANTTDGETAEMLIRLLNGDSSGTKGIGGITTTETEYINANTLSTENFVSERIFKLEVLDWLNNGEPKLFKSPTEGNYIVRIMNVSLSPENTLSRLIHSFSCTAYEIADFNYKELENYNFIVPVTYEAEPQTRWETVVLRGHDEVLDIILNNASSLCAGGRKLNLTEVQYNKIMSVAKDSDAYSLINKYLILDEDSKIANFKEGYLISNAGVITTVGKTIFAAFKEMANSIYTATGTINASTAYSVKISDAIPGMRFMIDDDEFMIGSTGSFYADLPDGAKKIYILKPGENIEDPDQDSNLLSVTGIQGSVTYSYKSVSVNMFDTISNCITVDIPCRQWIGTPTDIRYDSTKEDFYINSSGELFNCIENIKDSIIQFYNVKFFTRPVQPLFVSRSEEEYTLDTEFYSDMDGEQAVSYADFDPYTIYAVCYMRENKNQEYVPYENFEKYSVDCSFREGYYVLGPDEKLDVFSGTYIDGNRISKKSGLPLDDDPAFNTFTSDEYSTKIYINNSEVDLRETLYYNLPNLDDDVTSIIFDNGVICEASYQISRIDYNIEDNEAIKAYKADYEESLTNLLNLRDTEERTLSDEAYIEEENTYIWAIKKSYWAYLTSIEEALEEYKEVNS